MSSTYISPQKLRSPANPCASSFATFLRRQHPQATAARVAGLTGVPERTVESWLGEKSMPRVQHLGPLLAVYGPDALAAIFPNGLGWLDAHRRQERFRALEAQRAVIDAEMREICGN